MVIGQKPLYKGNNIPFQCIVKVP